MTMQARPTPAGELGHPFRWSKRDQVTLPVRVSGALPAWLQGQLVRTAPAEFQRGGVRAAHWFDGHGLIYGFEFGDGVHFQQQLLATDLLAEHDRGVNATATFASPMQRTLWQRLRAPIPRFTDNANVNIVPWQGQWLAMTETPHQHVIDARTLRSRGHYAYEDKLRDRLPMSAHPHFDAGSAAMVNIGAKYGPRSEMVFFRHAKDAKKREIEGRLALSHVPYLHSFGLTPRSTILIDHPLRASALRMLFSDKGFIRHFDWTPHKSTRFWKLDRQTGQFTSFETEPLFCFHTVNAYEEGGDVVFDFLAYDDASLIDALSTDSLAAQMPNVLPRLVRARLSPGKSDVALQRLCEPGFEFPQIAYRTHQGKRYRFVWGTQLFADAALGFRSELLKIDVDTGEVRRFLDHEFTFGEPVCVPRPGGAREDDGVLLIVGSAAKAERSRLMVLDAANLALLATCEVDLSLPLGFHGSFALARS